MAKYTTTGTSSSSTSRSTVSPSNSNWDIVDKGAAASRANETQAITLRSLGPDTYCDPCGCPPPSGGGGGDGGGGQPPIVVLMVSVLVVKLNWIVYSLGVYGKEHRLHAIRFRVK